jgi:hypothetical protein
MKLFCLFVCLIQLVLAVPEWDWFPLDDDVDSISNGYNAFFEMPPIGIKEFFFEKKNVPQSKDLGLEKCELVYPFAEPFPEDYSLKIIVNDQFHSIEAVDTKTHLRINIIPAMTDEWKNVTGKIVESRGNFVLLDSPFLLAKFYGYS